MFTLIALLATALAAPVAPASLAGTGGDVAVRAQVGRVALRDGDCTREACEAVRHEATQGVEAGLQIAGVVGLYGQVEHVHDAIHAADYAGDGWGAGGGVRVGIPLGRVVGVHAWGELSGARTTSDRGESTRIDLEAGAAVRVGDPLDGFVVWGGGAVIPWTSEDASLLDGAVEIRFTPTFPAQAVAGVLWISDGLDGPWNERARIGAGLNGRLGHRAGVEGWVGVTF